MAQVLRVIPESSQRIKLGVNLHLPLSENWFSTSHISAFEHFRDLPFPIVLKRNGIINLYTNYYP